MFLLRLAIVFLATSGIYSQEKLVADNQEKGYAFGKLRLSEDGKTEELIPSPNAIIPPNQDQSAGNSHPLPSPCVGTRPATKLPYPNEKTKYILCRDEYHYEIFTCPNGGEWNVETDACTYVAPTLDKCEQEKPCLYDGQCISLSNSTFKCICRPEWSGDRCEIPVNSCSKKPCGPDADCRPLKTTNLDQDYVCVCNANRGYGLSCQEIVPNPCLGSTEQFYPYAFSSHAYVHCGGDLIYFQPCGQSLYWNQEEKICDRKRPTKFEVPKLTKLTVNKDDYQGEKDKEIIDREKLITVQKPIEKESQVENKPILTNKLRSDFIPPTQQWPSQEQSRGSTFGTESSSLGSKSAQTQFGLNNEGQQQKFGGQQWTSGKSNEKNFAPVEIWRNFDSQSNQQPVGEMNVKESNVFRLPGSQKVVQPQTWQKNSEFIQTQQVPTMNVAESTSVDGPNRFNSNFQSNNQFERGQQNQFSDNSKWSNQPQQTFTQNNNRLPSSENQNTQEQVVSWPAKPSSQFSANQLPQTSNTQSVAAPREAWRRLNFRTGSSNLESQNTNTEDKPQSWQMQKPISMTENQFPQRNDSFVMQTRSFEEPEQSWRRAETKVPSQPQSFGETIKTGQNFQGQQTWEMRPNTQTTQSQFETTRTNPESFQSWRRAEAPPSMEQTKNSNSQSFGEMIKTGSNTWSAQNVRNQNTAQPAQTWENVNQPSFDQNSRLDSNTFISQNNQNGKVGEQDWKTQFSTPQNQKSKSQSMFAFRPMFETGRKSNQNENILSAQNPNNQFESTQTQAGKPVETSFEQTPTWVTNQQFPTQGGHQLTNTNDANMQTNRLSQPSVSQGLQNWEKPQTHIQTSQDDE